MKPRWENKSGYKCLPDHIHYSWFGLVPTSIWIVTFENPDLPTYLIDRNSRHWTWPHKLITDKNTIPACLRPLFPPEFGEPASFIHDPPYKGKGVFTRLEGEPWREMFISREQADDLIFQGWIAAGVPEKRAKFAWCILRSLAWMCWKGK